jgi:inner membrane protein
MDTANNTKSFFQKNHYLIKIAFIGFIALLLMIPIAFVTDIIRERESLRQQTKSEISQLWGGNQTMVTPILIIPFKETLQDSEKKSYITEKTLYISALDIKIDNIIKAEKRQKGIFSSIVYTNQYKVLGNFDLSTIPVDKNINYDYTKAVLQLGLTDPSSIASKVILKINDEMIDVQPGSIKKNVIENGLHASIRLYPETKNFNFSIEFDIRGSNNVAFILATKNAEINMNANWPNPSFIGKNLPKTREIKTDGFLANWLTNEFNNNTLAYWSDENINLSQSPPIVSVDLIETADDYQKNTRTSKYALFIIALSFCTFFVFEFLHKSKIHPIQYLLIGLALSVFYLLLLSLSEHLGFNMAYYISALAVTIIIVVYARAIIPNIKSTLILTGILVFLYSYIFVLMQLEDYSLLAGSIGLFLILALVMIGSRKVNWYAE